VSSRGARKGNLTKSPSPAEMTNPPAVHSPDKNSAQVDVIAWQEGNEWEWQKFNKVFFIELVTLFVSMGAGDEKEDLTQETLMRSFNSRHTFARDKSLRAWLKAIARNVWRNRLKKLYGEDLYTLDDLGPIASKHDVAHEFEVNDRLKFGKTAMSATGLEAFELRAQGYTDKEAATRRGVSPAAQKMAAIRAALAAQKALEESDE